VIVGLLVNQGLRVEEIKALKVQDLNLREGRITIHHQRRTAERTLELEAGQVYELMDYLAGTRKQMLQGHEGTTDDLFIQRREAVHFMVSGLRKAQYLAGHCYVSTTESYKEQLIDELKADVKKFHPL